MRLRREDTSNRVLRPTWLEAFYQHAWAFTLSLAFLQQSRDLGGGRASGERGQAVGGGVFPVIPRSKSLTAAHCLESFLAPPASDLFDGKGSAR